MFNAVVAIWLLRLSYQTDGDRNYSTQMFQNSCEFLIEWCLTASRFIDYKQSSLHVMITFCILLQQLPQSVLVCWLIINLFVFNGLDDTVNVRTHNIHLSVDLNSDVCEFWDSYDSMPFASIIKAIRTCNRPHSLQRKLKYSDRKRILSYFLIFNDFLK